MLMRSHPILSRFMIWIVFPIVIACGLIYGFMLQSLPQLEGSINVKGLQAPVTVTRDEHAIPHITASTDLDAFFTLGYVHAQERLWQMSYKKRIARGRLSEILGVDSLPMDQYMRAYDMVRASKSAFASLSPKAQQVLETYAAGVNAWLAEDHTLPVEFHILGDRPEQWTPVDSLLMIKFMALTLGPNHVAETEFDLLVKEVGLAKANDISPNVNAGIPAGSDTYAHQLVDPTIARDLIAINEKLKEEFKSGGEITVGSNAWVVSGDHTDTGMPLLAGDPHLLVEIPSLWYLAHIKGDKIDVTGATFAGVPLVFMGRNQSVAWGITNMFPDALDLYAERTNPENPNQYEVDGEWVDMDIEEQVIHIKPAFPSFLTTPIPPLKWQVRRTRHGPLISDGIRQVETPLAIRWTALDDIDRTFDSFLEINYAHDMPTFETAVRKYQAPAVNILYADKDNNIALYAAGKLPIRKRGNGRRPVPGWNSDYEWEKYIPFEEMPHTINPEKGYVANANNRNYDDDYPYIVQNQESPLYRIDRINQVLEKHIASGHKITVEDFITLQGDSKSLQVDDLLPFLTGLTANTEEQQEALDILREWDGVLTGQSDATAIYQTWMKFFNFLLIRDDLKGSLLQEARGNQLQMVPTMLRPGLMKMVVDNSPALANDWCDQVNTDERETCEDLALMALDATLDERGRIIAFSKEWKDVNEIYLPHLAFMNMPLLDAFFSRSLPGSSDRFSVNRGDWRYTRAFGYRVVSTAGYRQVIDLSEADDSGFINQTGQSEHLLSAHYDDNIPVYRDLQLRPMNLDPNKDASELAVLQLIPAR